MNEDTTVPNGGTNDPTVSPASITVVVSGTPPTSQSGPVSVDRIGIDTAGNIWLMYPRIYNSAGVGSGGWTYAATVTSGGLPLTVESAVPGGGSKTED